MPPNLIDLETHERQLDRLMAFFPRLDAKVSALFAIMAGQIAVAMLNLSASDLTVWWIVAPLAVFGVFAVWAFIHLYLCAYPHLKGGNSSLVYFAEISKLREAEYVQKYSGLTNDALKSDVAAQIWRNAEIVCCKYRYLKNATIAAMLSLIPWTLFLLAVSLAHWQIPKVG
jgi:hypothetical protein